MKIFGHPMSTCTRKVLMTLAETSTPYDFVLVDFAKGEHKQAPHTQRQPFGQVPALEAADGNIARAARLSGKPRRAFFALMRKHGVIARR